MGPGDVIADRYRVERLLGSGGMGAVWAATHLVTNKPVALKVLRREDDDENARRRVLREARAACAVRHASVVAVHDVIEASDGSPVLVMDLLDGEPLRARLDRDRTLPVDEVVRIAETMLEALDAAHAAGIVHRDLKPDNLFAMRDGRVMLLDFGIAKLVAKDGPAAGPGTLTATGAMVGTPFYMAPEQAFGEPIDGRADLWATGIVMFECLAGEPPTRGENLGQVLRILSTGRIARLGDRAPEVPEAIAAVVDALLAIDPSDRPANARAALEALRAAAGEGAMPAARASRTTERPKAAALSSPPASRIAEASKVAAGWKLSRRVGAAAAMGLAAGVIVAVMFVRGLVSTPPPIAQARAIPPAPAMATTAIATAVDPAPMPSTTASAKPSASAPKPSKSARPSPSASAPLPAPSASSSAPRLLTDLPF